MKVHEVLYALRKLRELSIVSMAYALDISGSMYSRIERGGRALVSESFAVIAEHLEVPSDTFLRCDDCPLELRDTFTRTKLGGQVFTWARRTKRQDDTLLGLLDDAAAEKSES